MVVCAQRTYEAKLRDREARRAVDVNVLPRAGESDGFEAYTLASSHVLKIGKIERTIQQYQ